MESSLASGSGYIRMVAGALLLRDEIFHKLADDSRPFARGLIFILLIGVIVALVSVVGTVLTEWTSPDMLSIRSTVEAWMDEMPWREQIPQNAIDEVDAAMDQQFEFVWRIINTVMPSTAKAIAGIVVQPLAMVLVWLVFGMLAYLVAKALDGSGTLAQTYGATSLAAAPYLLGVVHVLPYVQASGLGVWALICAYLGVKHAHQLTPGRAFWAVFISLAIIFVVASAVGVGAVAAFAVSQFGTGGGGQ